MNVSYKASIVLYTIINYNRNVAILQISYEGNCKLSLSQYFTNFCIRPKILLIYTIMNYMVYNSLRSILQIV